MRSTVTQRWRGRCDVYRPAGEPIRTADYDVAPIDGDAEAKAFVLTHHYEGSYPAALLRYGLYRRGALAGVAVFSRPVNDRTLTAPFPGVPVGDLAELGRFVLLDEVPANGETWFLGRAFELLRREGVEGIVSHSDPAPRTTADGRVVFLGHLGVIYQAFNACYRGVGDPSTVLLLPDGRVLNRRALQKVRCPRGPEKGYEAVVRLLVGHGAAPPRGDTPQVLRPWLKLWTGRLTRPTRHPGKHRYAWGLTRRARRLLPATRPYPKPPRLLFD